MASEVGLATAPPSDPIALHVRLLGGFAVWLGTQELPLIAFAKRKATSLLKLLALQPNHSLHREQVMEVLWPDLSPEAAAAQLYNTIYQLRKAFESASAHASEQPLVLKAGVLRLQASGGVSTDVGTFTELADRALHTREPADLEAAAASYGGELLPDDLLEEWSLAPRETLRETWLELLLTLGEVLVDKRDAEAAAAFEQVLHQESASEAAHRGLMKLAVKKGDWAGLERQYQQCRAALAKALGVEPSQETVALYRRLLERKHTALAHNLPTPPTPFVGRTAELQSIAEKLERPACRLLTLLGPGGVGKTRLALEVASGQLGVFAHGVYFVALASVASTENLITAITNALGLTPPEGDSPKAQLRLYFRNKDLLLVLDNFEHLLVGRTLLQELLEDAPGLKLLVTSRERLRLQGEWVVEIAGLEVPKEDGATELEAFSAVQLFLQSAQRVQAGLALTPTNAPAVRHICQRVEGLPLALELAAAWVNILSCQEIVLELERGSAILGDRVQGVPERHRSIQAVFEYSWQLLSEAEQRAFARLAIFQGGMTKEAAAQVAGADLSLLAALVDKSLVRRSASGRFDLHELLRQFCFLKLQEARDETPAREAHLGFFLDLAEVAEVALRGPEQRAWLERLEEEHDNLRAALPWALETLQVESALRLGAALWRFWVLHGHLREGRKWLEAALARSQEVGDPNVDHLRLRAKALDGLGELVRLQGDWTLAHTLSAASLNLCRTIGDQHGIMQALHSLGLVAQYQNDYQHAGVLHQECLALAQQMGDKVGIYISIYNLGEVARFQGRLEDAERLHEESLFHKRQQGDLWSVAWSLDRLGSLAAMRGDLMEATLLHRECLELRWQLQDKVGIARCFENLASVATATGEFVEAARLLGSLDTLLDRTGATLPKASRLKVEEVTTVLRQQVGAPAFTQNWEVGRSMRLEEAVALALNELTAPPEQKDPA